MSRDAAPILAALEALMDSQKRMEGALSRLAADQQAVADAVGVCAREQPPQRISLAASSRSARDGSSKEAEEQEEEQEEEEEDGEGVDLDAAALAAAAAARRGQRAPEGFLAKLAEAEATIGKENILTPAAAKAFLNANPETLFLDVQDTDANTVPGVYRASLGQLYFKASTDLPDFRDPIIADRDRELPILVTCGLGGQAKLGAKVLVDYGFTNVKTVDGGCVAWKAYNSSYPALLPANWPAGVPRRTSFAEECDDIALEAAEHQPSLHGGDVGRTQSNLQALARLPRVDEGRSASRNTLSSSTFTRPERGLFVMAPISGPRIALDVISVLLLVFDVISVPWILAWDVKVEGWLKTCAVFMVCFWTAEIFFSFRTGFFQHGEVKMQPSLIARRYLKTWFVPDVVMVLLDWAAVVLLFIEDSESQPGEGDRNRVEIRMMGILRFTKWSRVLRLLSMFRFARFSDAFERILDRSYYSPSFLIIFQVVRLIFFIAYVNHIGACVWWGIGNKQVTGNRWVDLDVDETGQTYLHLDPMHQYVVSLHWAMTQILAGSMQVSSTNVEEHLVTVCCLVFGVLFLSSVVSTLASKMTQLRMMNQDKTTKMAQLREFLRRKSVGAELAVNVIKQVDESLKERKPAALNQLQVWSVLSQRNRSKLHLEMCKPHLLRHPFFMLVSHVDAKLVRLLCDKAIRINVHSQHDTIFAAAAPAHEMYGILEGCLKYTQEPDTAMVLHEVDERVYKGTWVCEAALWTQWTHVGTLETLSVCEILVLEAGAAAEVLHRNMHVCTIAGEYCRAYLARVHAAKPPQADWPSDLSVPYASFREIMSTTSPSVSTFVSMLALRSCTGSLSWTPWQHGLRDAVQSGRCALVPTVNGDVDIIVSTVALHLERQDGLVLACLGTWDGHAAVPSCSLPGTRQLAGELPGTAFQRLLRTQLRPFAELTRLRRCTLDVQVKSGAKPMIHRWKAVTTHVAALLADDGPYLPTANIGIATGQFMTRMSSVSSKYDVEEVFVVAGEPDTQQEDSERPVVLQLFAWLAPSVLEHLGGASGQKRLQSLLAKTEVSEATAQEALAMYDAGKFCGSVDLSSTLGRWSKRERETPFQSEREEKEECEQEEILL